MHLSACCHAEEAKSFCAKRKIVRLRMIFRLAQKKIASCPRQCPPLYEVGLKHG
ncbi:hypothetical protein HMPREF9442_02079 [Paraprevotella xylaniphila YIT 11841]|uniref:Uncharacterized protein n=1 Tax=Paraprevotella xylaniphila YIT 11841 TaxID=762982 RepID=F3QV54_9BACT|nr:hypothetical protein HMPREF9442_02079 [Paraprevotella xylaniphila YIT 11841]